LMTAVSLSFMLVIFSTSKQGRYELHKISMCSDFKGAFLFGLNKCGQV
jgi:hypothetical protein